MSFPQTEADRHRTRRTRRMRPWAIVPIAVVLVVLAVAWSVTPLARLLDPRVLVAYEQQIRDWPLAPLAVVVVHVLSGLIATPGTLMVGATVLLFGAWPGALYAFAGMIANGITVYAIGRFAARDAVDQWLASRSGSWLDSLNRQLARRGFLAIALIRLVPIPYSLVNVVAGASRIGFADYVLGTAIGILPVIALMAGVASQFEAWLEHPDWSRLFGLIGVAAAVLAIAWAIRLWAVRKSGQR